MLFRSPVRILASLLLLAISLQLGLLAQFARVTPQVDSELPKVLIIGDSISKGYGPYVIEALKDKAYVTRHAGNAGPTLRGLENIDAWIGPTKWDVIHFNWGLWDMYHWQYFDFDQSPKAYESNLRTLVHRLKQTGAKLIWATTTPACPAPEIKHQVQVDSKTELKYLRAAHRVMQSEGIAINDLNRFMASRRSEYALGDDDVHYTPEGYRALAEQVVARIAAHLDK